MGVSDKDPIAQLSLPPGFRFFPTDEELLVQYLCQKVAGHQFSLQLIAEIDLYKFDPWVLPSKAVFGEKEWYFFSPRDRKYANGSRPNRVAGSGYWKATGTDKGITSQGKKVGFKKALVFYIGKAPKGTKTNWIMHEFVLSNSPSKSGRSKLDDWVMCRIYKKSTSAEKAAQASVASEEQSAGGSTTSTTTSHLDDVMDSLPEIKDSCFALPRMNSLRANQAHFQQQQLQQEDQKLGLQSLFGSGNFDWSVLAGLTAGSEIGPVGVSPNGCMPCLPQLCHVDYPEEKLGNRFEEEVQNGLRDQRVSAGGWGVYDQGPNVMMAQSYLNSGDPFGIRCTDQYPMAGFGFRE